MPKPIVFSLRFLVCFLLLGQLVRGGFHYAFSEGASHLGFSVVAKAYLLGLRYDLRLCMWILLPVLVFSLFSRFSPFQEGRARRLAWMTYFGMVAVTWVLAQLLDFAHYAYLGTKLAASIVNFLADPKESALMVWQTYPVVWLNLLWGVLSLTLIWLIRLNFQITAGRAARVYSARKRGLIWASAGLLLIIGIHGRFSQYPLRWSDAYFNPSPFVAALALNPVLNLYDTRKYVGAGYSLERVQEAYPRMATYLGVESPDIKSLNFDRAGKLRPNKFTAPPNVVLVLLESFSGYKSSLTDNPLNPTPFLKELASSSVYFDRFYTPHTGTARGVFATLTGIPDVDLRSTSSRNPAAVEQHSLVSALKGYDAHYFIGGSTTWANVRGVIRKNIPNLQIYEEGNFTAPVVDVWGISDKSLFLEANAVFRASIRPFFSVIQTAGNHRPYTIPAEDVDFKRDTPSDSELKRNGFFSVEEYNAFRYMDYSVRQFIEAASREVYFDNTIFVFLGDHGIAAQGHDVGPHMPRAYMDLRLSAVHTPMIIYAPGHLRPARYSTVGSQIDVMPTVLGLTGVKFRMQALGRDLLDPDFDDQRYAFTVYHDGVGEIGLMDADWYYIKKANAKIGTLHALVSVTPGEDLAARYPEIASRFNQKLDDYYQTAQYMLINNRQKPHTGD